MTKDHEFQLPLVNGDLNHTGVKATEMSRRMIKRQMLNRKGGRGTNRKGRKAKKEQKHKEQEHDFQMQETDFGTIKSTVVTIHHKQFQLHSMCQRMTKVQYH